MTSVASGCCGCPLHNKLIAPDMGFWAISTQLREVMRNSRFPIPYSGRGKFWPLQASKAKMKNHPCQDVATLLRTDADCVCIAGFHAPSVRHISCAANCRSPSIETGSPGLVTATKEGALAAGSGSTLLAFYCDHHVVPLPEGHRFPMDKWDTSSVLSNLRSMVDLCLHSTKQH